MFQLSKSASFVITPLSSQNQFFSFFLYRQSCDCLEHMNQWEGVWHVSKATFWSRLAWRSQPSTGPHTCSSACPALWSVLPLWHKHTHRDTHTPPCFMSCTRGGSGSTLTMWSNCVLSGKKKHASWGLCISQAHTRFFGVLSFWHLCVKTHTHNFPFVSFTGH